MRRKLRKVIVFTLFSVMITSSPMSVWSEEIERLDAVDISQGDGIIRPDIYQVILPTDVNGIFDFVLDPQKLLEETNGAIYGGRTFEKGATVFFHRSDGKTADEYSSSSDYVTIINKSNVPVDILVDVSILPESLGNITMTNDREFTNDISTSLYMALTDGEYTIPIGIGDSYIQVTVPAAPEDAFEYNYDQESGEYSYGLKEDLGGVQLPEYSFQLTGAVNEKGDWSTVENVALLVNVTWKVMPSQSLDFDKKENVNKNITSEISDMVLESDIDSVLSNNTLDENSITNDTDMELKEGTTPYIEKTSYTLEAGKPISIGVDLGSGNMAATKIVSVRWKETDNEILEDEKDTEAVKYEDGKLLFSKEWVEECILDMSGQASVLVVTFDDVGQTEEEIVLNY